jgi:hypothetical protein
VTVIANTLSVTASVTSCGLSPGVIAGIAIATVLAGVGVGVAVVAIWKYEVAKLDVNMSRALRNEAMADAKTEFTQY